MKNPCGIFFIICLLATVCSGDNFPKILELEAKIAATQAQMVEVLSQALKDSEKLASREEKNAVMEVAKQKVELLQKDMNSFRAMREQLSVAAPTDTNKAYPISQESGLLSKIKKGENENLTLENGAIVKVSKFNGFSGYFPWANNCLLFNDGKFFKIWIEEKGAFSCELLKMPTVTKRVEFSQVIIDEVGKDGAFVKLRGGQILIVRETDRLRIELLLGPKEALLLDNGDLVILEGGKFVRTQPAKQDK
jgi:hypothetical protein